MQSRRKRHPEDVPTPVAVAVADFCRRAKAPASPGLVRDALSLLSDDDDIRVREMTDAEPTARLGPFGLVDVILGTTVSLASEREQLGYYEQVRKAVQENARKFPLPAPPVLTSAPPQRAEPPVAKPSSPRPSQIKPSPKQSLKEKIAPQRRRPGEAEARPRLPAPLPGTAFLPKRNLPAPRGRFTTVDPSRANFESLFRPEGKDVIESLIEQVPHRVALLRTLEQGYIGRRGEALSVGDVEDVLEEHELFEKVEKKEREGLLAALIDEKGSLSRTAQAFGVTFDELEKMIGALGVDNEVDQVRERFTKQALAAENLSLRLELLFRTRYLEDLGIEKKFQQTLSRQLEALVNEVKDAATSVPTLVDLLSRQHALHADSLRRALEKLGLTDPWLKNVR